MSADWSTAELAAIDAAAELEIAVRRPDGGLRPWTPIWVVRTGGEVYVRTWYRRSTGWFGHALSSGRARIRVPGVETDVEVEDVGSAGADLVARVAASYRRKYGAAGAGSMVTAGAATTTLRLVPER